MKHRKLLCALSIFHAITNTLYLVRFFGVFAPEPIVYGYVPWFMSYALPNVIFTLLAWVLVYSLCTKKDALATLTGLLVAGGLIFHASASFMFAFYTGSFMELTLFNAIFEIMVYVYGLALATFYITQFWAIISKRSKEE